MHAQPAAFVLRRLQFVPAHNKDAHGVSALELASLIPLNAVPEEPLEAPGTEGAAMKRPTGKAASRQGRKELFSAEELSLQWREMRKAGAGLQNLGNTCFMNSVLQSLVHTPPLAELLLSAVSARLPNGAVNGFYPIQLARDLVARSLAHATRGPLAPMQFAKSLRRISRSFRLGRQEDAHEFLIALLDAMHEASIAGVQPKPTPELAQTSFIYRIFGGRMRSQVKCSECGYESNTFDPCIDLSLEITRAQTVTRALERFTAGEVLDGSNKYKCPKQSKSVRAVKRMTVDAAPNVLMIQLKRFEFSMSGHKISKKVDFDLELDLGPYMSERPKGPAMYDLYAVLVHSGHSVHSGHYYSYVRAPNGMWHICDDTHVAQVAERQVMAQKAYILFYLKRQPISGWAAPPHSHSTKSGTAASSKGMTPSAAGTPAAPSAASPAAVSVPRKLDVEQKQKKQKQRKEKQELQQQDMQQQQQQQDMQQQQQQQQQQDVQQQQAAAAPTVAPAAAATANGVSRKRRERPESTVGSPQAQQQQQQPASPPAAAAGAAEQPPRHKRHEEQGEQQQNGRISKKPRLRAMKKHAADVDGELPELLPLPRKRTLVPASPLVMGLYLGRAGARHAEAVAISQHPPTREMRERKAQAAAAAVAAAAEAEAAAAAAAEAEATPVRGAAPATAAASRDDSGSSGGGGGGSGTTSVVSAPDWPPVKQQRQQQAAAAAEPGGDEAQAQQSRRVKQPQQQQRAAGPASGGSAQTDADVKAFLRRSGGGTRLPLKSWEDAPAAAKQQKAALEHQEMPKRKRQDEYDREYDMGRTKKVKTKQAGEEGGVNGHMFDAAWSQIQRDGVQTELRGNRKRRSEDHSSGGRGGGWGRGAGRGRGGRGGGGRDGGRGGRGRGSKFGGGRGGGRGRR